MPDTPASSGRSPDRQPLRIGLEGGLRRYLEGIRELDRNVKLLLTVTAFRGMVIAALGTILNLYLYSLGYDARFIGIINGVNSLAVLLVSVPLGYLADRIGRRPVLLVGGVAYPASILALGLARSTPALLIVNFVFGVVATTYWVAGIPLLVASTTERQRVQAFSINSFLLWGVGPLASFLSGAVVEVAAGVLHVPASSSAALRVGMLFMAGLAAVGAIPYPFLREPPHSKDRQARPPPGSRMTLLFIKLLVPDVALAFGLGATLTFIQLYFHLRFHLDPGPIGVILAVGGLIAGLGTLSTPAVARRWGNLRTAVRFQWMVALPTALLALSTQLALAIPAYWLVLTLRGMSDPVYTAFVQEQVPGAYRARIAGLYNVTYSIGFSLGPAASGQLQKIGGFTPAFLMGMACYFAGASLLYVFFVRPERRAGAQAGVTRSPVTDAGE
jgi:MFS family permease